MTAESTFEDQCFDRCNACGHVHSGFPSGYRCPRSGCDCRDRFDPEAKR